MNKEDEMFEKLGYKKFLVDFISLNYERII